MRVPFLPPSDVHPWTFRTAVALLDPSSGDCRRSEVQRTGKSDLTLLAVIGQLMAKLTQEPLALHNRVLPSSGRSTRGDASGNADISELRSAAFVFDQVADGLVRLTV